MIYRTIAFILLTLVLSIAMSAPQPFTGQVETVSAGPGIGDKVVVRVVGHAVDAPYSTACSSGFWTFAFIPSAPGGKEALSILLTAYSTKKDVMIQGLGTCTVHSIIQDMESVRFAN